MIGPTSAAVRRSESAITLVRKADEQISQSRYLDAASTLERAGKLLDSACLDLDHLREQLLDRISATT